MPEGRVERSVRRDRGIDDLVGIPVAPDGSTASGEDARYRGYVRLEDRSNEDIATDEELGIDSEELRLIWELEEERTDRWSSACRCVRKEGILPEVDRNSSSPYVVVGREKQRTQYGSMLYLTAIAVFDAFATLSHRYGSCEIAPISLWFL